MHMHTSWLLDPNQADTPVEGTFMREYQKKKNKREFYTKQCTEVQSRAKSACSVLRELVY
jgi:hypothetical protein